MPAYQPLRHKASDGVAVPPEHQYGVDLTCDTTHSSKGFPARQRNKVVSLASLQGGDTRRIMTPPVIHATGSLVMRHEGAGGDSR